MGTRPALGSNRKVALPVAFSIVSELGARRRYCSGGRQRRSPLVEALLTPPRLVLDCADIVYSGDSSGLRTKLSWEDLCPVHASELPHWPTA